MAAQRGMTLVDVLSGMGEISQGPTPKRTTDKYQRVTERRISHSQG